MVETDRTAHRIVDGKPKYWGEEGTDGYEYFHGASQTLSDGTIITVHRDGYVVVNCPTYGEYIREPGEKLPIFEDPTVVTDLTGTKYGIGDMVAVATVNQKSPQLVFGEVVKFSATEKDRRRVGVQQVTRRLEATFRDDNYLFSLGYGYDLAAWTTTVQPLMDGRNFYRSIYDDGLPRKQTYKFSANIVKVRDFR